MSETNFTSGMKLSENDWMSQSAQQQPYFDPGKLQSYPGYSGSLSGYNAGGAANFKTPETMSLMPFSGADEMTKEFQKIENSSNKTEW